MLPFALVLFAAQCVFGAPSNVNLNAYNINEISPVNDNGRLVSSYLTNGVFELSDGGTSSVFQLYSQQIVDDLANQPDAYSQALGVSQAIAIAGARATGVPGDSCVSAALVNAWTSGGNVRDALRNYVNQINTNIDYIRQLAVNPSALRNVAGGRGHCPGGGRTYPFEAAWDKLLDNANPYQIGLINEQYCSARRLYSANNLDSNNLAAAITASSVEPVVQIMRQSINSVAAFLRAVIEGGNVNAAASQAKTAINNAASRV